MLVEQTSGGGGTVAVHVHAEALLEAARLALVAAREVHDASAALAARVRYAASHRPFEEAAAAVAARHAVVLPAARTGSSQAQ